MSDRPLPRYRVRRTWNPTVSTYQWLIYRWRNSDQRYRLTCVRLTFAAAIEEVNLQARVDLIGAVARLGSGIPSILLKEAHS